MTEHDTPQQLTLLPSSDVPLRFRIDAETRRRGIRHIAEIRQQLAERQAARADTPAARPPARIPGRPTAA
jgi:hypothetical protein